MRRAATFVALVGVDPRGFCVGLIGVLIGVAFSEGFPSLLVDLILRGFRIVLGKLRAFPIGQVVFCIRASLAGLNFGHAGGFFAGPCVFTFQTPPVSVLVGGLAPLALRVVLREALVSGRLFRLRVALPSKRSLSMV